MQKILWIVLLTVIAAQANAQTQLRYDEPARNFSYEQRWTAGDRGNPNNIAYMQEALPLGNGRLGAMFSGGIDREHLMINDITLWMNAQRGLDETAQSGTRIGAYKNLDTVRQVYREGNYGTGEGSMEAISTKYLSSTQPLGNYAPFTDLFISTGHDSAAVSSYTRTLDIRSGIGKVSYSMDDAHFTREYFASHPHDVVAVRYTAQKTKMDITIDVSTLLDVKSVTAEGNYIVLNGEAPMEQDDIAFQQLVYIDPGKGTLEPQEDGTMQVVGTTDVKIYLAAYTDYLPVYPSFKGRDYKSDTGKTMDAAVTMGYENLKKTHTQDVAERMDRCQLDLDYTPSGLTTDKLVEQRPSLELENLIFNYSRYLQLSSSRTAPVPSNLQGMWNGHTKPAWNSDYHIDINLAMNYWMVETANLSGSFSPYAEWMKIQAQSGAHSARETFGVNKGWSMGLNGNVFGFTAQNWHGRRIQQSSHWLSRPLFDHYAFNQDRAYLEAIYPILKGSAEFFVGHLAPWKDGTLVVYPTWSPENAFLVEQYGDLNKQAYGTTYDQQLVLNLFTDVIEASTVLGRDEAFRKTLKELIPKLNPQKIGHWGQLQEWPEDWDRPDDTHRHISHLIALHPGRDISLLTNEELAKAARTTLAHRDAKNEEGWDAAWRISFWARLLDGNNARENYLEVISGFTSNLLNAKGTFQIDANFGAAAGVTEMLLQSHLRSINNEADRIHEAAFNAYKKDPEAPNNFRPVVPDDKLADAPYINHLLPALPDAWPSGSITGLRARGGFEVDIDWEDGELEQATIRAIKGGDFRIYANNSLSKVISLDKGETMTWKDQ